MATTERTDVERHNNLVFVAIVVALVLSFVSNNQIAFVVEVVARVLVVVLVGYGLVTFRRGYFSHWTSWLTTAAGVRLGAADLPAVHRGVTSSASVRSRPAKASLSASRELIASFR